MAEGRNQTVSLLGFVASILTIFAFATGIYSLPALLEGRSLPLAEVGRPTLSYGALLVSQAAFFLCYFLATRFLFERVIRGFSRTCSV